jgi:hypothetical protein
MRRHIPHLCSACRRPSAGWSFEPSPGAPRAYACDTPGHFTIVQDTYDMTDIEFSALEHRAVAEGGKHAGQYLDALRKTDLAQLTPDEWHQFLLKVVDGYRTALELQLAHQPPF